MELRLTNVRRSLGAREVIAGVTLTVGEGGIAVVQGENGAGKSTLLGLVAGLLPAHGGEMRLGSSLLDRDGVKYKAQLGYVPDATNAFPDLRVGEYIALVQSLKRRAVRSAEIPDGWLRRLGVEGFWRQRVGSLSFGQRKRMCSAAALSGDPWLLVLDEPSNGLDPAGVDLILELIQERVQAGRAALCSSNDPTFAARLGGDHYRLAGGQLQRQSAGEHASLSPSPLALDDAAWRRMP